MTKHLKWISDAMLKSSNALTKAFGVSVRTAPLVKVTREALPPHGEDFTALLDISSDEYQNGGLPLPFPEFIFEMDGMLVRIWTKEIQHPCVCVSVAFFDSLARTIQTMPSALVFVENQIVAASWIGPNGEFEPYLANDDSCAINYGFSLVIGVLALIRMSYARVEIIDVTEENKRRARMNRPPIPEQRTIVLDTENSARIVFRKGGTHASPVGHLRRSHVRRLQTGKIVTVSASSIRGGPTTHPAHYVIQ